MRVVYFTLLAVLMPCFFASAKEYHPTPNLNIKCISLHDEIAQASYYYHTTQQAVKNGNKKILVPIGHFSTYLGVEEASSALEERLSMLKTFEKSCTKLNQKTAETAKQKVARHHLL